MPNQLTTGSNIVDKKAMHKATGPKQMPKEKGENMSGSHPANTMKPMRSVDKPGRNQKMNRSEKVDAG